MKLLGTRRGLFCAALALVLSVPCFAAIPFDPGAKPMVWHVYGASVLLIVLKWRSVADLLSERLRLRSTRAMGFVFAMLYALLSLGVFLNLFNFGGQPMPRFNDIFLIGVALTAYFFTWDSAVFLLGIGVLFSAWILPPNGNIRVEGITEWYRLISFTLVAGFIILLVNRIKGRKTEEEPLGRLSTTSGD